MNFFFSPFVSLLRLHLSFYSSPLSFFSFFFCRVIPRRRTVNTFRLERGLLELIKRASLWNRLRCGGPVASKAEAGRGLFYKFEWKATIARARGKGVGALWSNETNKCALAWFRRARLLESPADNAAVISAVRGLINFQRRVALISVPFRPISLTFSERNSRKFLVDRVFQWIARFNRGENRASGTWIKLKSCLPIVRQYNSGIQSDREIENVFPRNRRTPSSAFRVAEIIKID